MNLILSTCGTSILTNQLADDRVKSLLRQYSNVKSKKDVPENDRMVIEQRISEAKARFLNSEVKDAHKESAELAGILSIYGNNPDNGKGDLHFLLATDTWLGNETSLMTKEWLGKHKITAEVYQHPDLQTADWNLFSSSLSDLVKWCEEKIGSIREHYRVIFNLSGGFKSETGFLQVLGMFYADETVYIFERSEQLMRIPHLPVKMEDSSWVEKDLRDIRRAASGLNISEKENMIYWTTIEGNTMITPWGQLVFAKSRKELYGTKLWPSISEQVVFTETFYDSCKGQSPKHLIAVNETIDQLAAFQELPNQPNPHSLDFKPIMGNGYLGSTHECDAWADDAAWRIYCRKDGNRILVDRLDHHL